MISIIFLQKICRENFPVCRIWIRNNYSLGSDSTYYYSNGYAHEAASDFHPIADDHATR
jgi:hypothetical protein